MKSRRGVGKKVGQNKSNEKDGNNRKKKTMVKMYDLNSDEELNADFGMADHDDNSNTDDKYHISIATV